MVMTSLHSNKTLRQVGRKVCGKTLGRIMKQTKDKKLRMRKMAK